MDYKVVVTVDAEEDLDRFIQYLLFEKESRQAAQNVLVKTQGALHFVKGSLLSYIILKLRFFVMILLQSPTGDNTDETSAHTQYKHHKCGTGTLARSKQCC